MTHIEVNRKANRKWHAEEAQVVAASAEAHFIDCDMQEILFEGVHTTSNRWIKPKGDKSYKPSHVDMHALIDRMKKIHMEMKLLEENTLPSFLSVKLTILRSVKKKTCMHSSH